jgi:hypothetical protein
VAAVAAATETVDVDGNHEAVVAFALVQIGRCGLSQILVVDSVEGEEGPLDLAHLPERLGKTALPCGCR